MFNKRTYKIFDKMKSKYSSDVYTIIKVNKKNVNIENDEIELNGIKKTAIIITKQCYNNGCNTIKCQMRILNSMRIGEKSVGASPVLFRVPFF